jgi:hypothetical protein
MQITLLHTHTHTHIYIQLKNAVDGFAPLRSTKGQLTFLTRGMSKKDARLFRQNTGAWYKEWKIGELAGSWAQRVDILHRNVRSLLYELSSSSSSEGEGEGEGGAGGKGGAESEACPRGDEGDEQRAAAVMSTTSTAGGSGGGGGVGGWGGNGVDNCGTEGAE